MCLLFAFVSRAPQIPEISRLILVRFFFSLFYFLFCWASLIVSFSGFASELLLGRYELPAPLRPDSLLHRHEVGLMNEARRIIDTLESHRSEEFNRSILPLCQPLVEAIGHRMAYESALDAGVPQCLIDLYEISVIKLDSIWYSENAGMTRETIRKREEEAYTAVLPRLEEFLDEMDMDAFTDAPIVSDEKWRAFTRGLKTFTSDSSVGFAQKAHL